MCKSRIVGIKALSRMLEIEFSQDGQVGNLICIETGFKSITQNVKC